jgi:hypothetical protein
MFKKLLMAFCCIVTLSSTSLKAIRSQGEAPRAIEARPIISYYFAPIEPVAVFYHPSISISEIRKVTKSTRNNIERYHALLVNGDAVTANYFYTGDLRGQIHCTKTTVVEGDFMRSTPVDEEAFYILKRFYEDSRSHPAIAELD